MDETKIEFMNKDILIKIAVYMGMINDDYSNKEKVDLKMQDNSPDISCMKFKNDRLNSKDVDFNIWIDKLLENADKSNQDSKIESLLRIIGGDDGK